MAETIYRKDYQPPRYLVDEIDLSIALDPSATRVTSRMIVRRNPAAGPGPLILDGGREMELVSVRIGNRTLEADDYKREGGKLDLGEIEALAQADGKAIVEIETRIAPDKNTDYEGLYVSNGTYCTQCEAEGFRRITFYPDRPDVLAKFRVRLEGDKAKTPILLAGGNPVEAGELPEGRHYAVFNDPYPKPAYLFALVGGDLDWIEDSFTTMTGRKVALRIYVDKGNGPKALWAMKSLIASMAWDEKVFGREYQLDVFSIVAVHDFNAGAMENTGLNIFNAKNVLADAETATDTDFNNIQAVIAHEYFHNWSGNRVTVRDWFQLSLKEGFTVYRDQEFSADMNNRTIERIGDVDRLRRAQFVEDAGPTAHPIRLESCQSVQNFYTTTVYEKGAEVVRMIAHLLGPEKFRAATDLYFSRNDGQAVTCDDFVTAMEDASGIDLAQFRLWYSQAGTPQVTAKGAYDSIAKTWTLTLTQIVPPTPGQPAKQPMMIPVALGLLDGSGKDMNLILQGETGPGSATRVLSLTEASQSFTFVDVDEKPVPSFLRGFSAPVRFEDELTVEDRLFLMRHDSDGFNRCMAARALSTVALKGLLASPDASLPQDYIAAVESVLETELPPAMTAEMLTLPAKSIFAQEFASIDIEGITRIYEEARAQLAARLAPHWMRVFETNRGAKPYTVTSEEMGKRSLKNLALSYLASTEDDAALDLAETQYREADNMTDRMAAMAALVRYSEARGQIVLDNFYQRYRGDQLVIDKWFALQAGLDVPGRLAAVQALIQHADFTLANPNRVYATLGAFATQVSPSFHDISGEGYAFLCQMVETLDGINPQVAARMVTPLLQWRRYDSARQAMMQRELQALMALPALSTNTRENIEKSLAR